MIRLIRQQERINNKLLKMLKGMTVFSRFYFEMGRRDWWDLLDEIEVPVRSLKIALLTRPPVKVRKRIGVYGLCLTMVIEKYYLMCVSL